MACSPHSLFDAEISGGLGRDRLHHRFPEMTLTTIDVGVSDQNDRPRVHIALLWTATGREVSIVDRYRFRAFRGRNRRIERFLVGKGMRAIGRVATRCAQRIGPCALLAAVRHRSIGTVLVGLTAEILR